MKGDDYTPTLAGVLRAIFDLDGLDARQLAARMNRNEGVVGKWVRGESMPRPEAIVELADALDAPVDILMRPPASRYLVFAQMLARRGVLQAERDGA